MPRGGERPNAGRKPKLDKVTRLQIGAAIETQWRKACDQKAKAEIDQTKGSKKLSVEWAKAERLALEWARENQVPLTDKGGNVTYRKAWLKTQEGKDHSEDVVFALREVQGIAPEYDREPSRMRQVVPKRPKGKLNQLIREAAAHFGISERMARRCLEEARAFANQVNERDEDV